MGLGSNHLTPSTSAVFIPEIWSPEILRATENAYVMAPLVKRFDSEVQSRGDTVHIPNLSNLTATDKAVQTAVTLSSPTETDTQILINKHKHVAFLLEDITKIQSDYDLMGEYTQKAGSAIAKSIDTDLLSEYSNFSNTDVGSYGVDISDSVILAASEAIDLANAPITDRYFVVYTTQKTALLKIEKFFKADYMGEYDKPTIVRTGPNSRYLWGEIYGMPVYWTQQVTQTAGTPTQTHNIMFHKEAIALAVQSAPRTQSQMQLEYLGNLVVVDVIYGVKTIRADFGVEVRS
jgi:P22 coat protein - gene protein 5